MSQIGWAGPVSIAQVGATSLPGDHVGVIQCKGDGSPSCGQMADSWPQASKVASFLSAAKLDPSDPDGVILRAFSAGGSMFKRVLLGDDAGRVRVVALSDATYTDWASPGNPTPPEGFVRFGLEALKGDRMLVATASSAPNGKMPNGSQTLEALKNEIERRSGVSFREGGNIPGMPTQPMRLWTHGSVILADYGNLTTHTQHATKLAAPLWENVIVPWLGGSAPVKPGPQVPPGPMIADELAPWVLALIGSGCAVAGFYIANNIRNRIST